MSSLQCPTTMILARHGDAEYESRTWGDEGGSLTPGGRAQSRSLGECLRDCRIAHVWSSTMARAVQTAEIAAGVLDVGVTTRHGLREFACGDFRGSSMDVNPFLPYVTPWLAGDLSGRLPGGESGEELRERLHAVLAEIADLHRGETVLVVSHGGLLRSMVPALCRMSASPARIASCGTIEVLVDDDGWVCSAWADGPTTG